MGRGSVRKRLPSVGARRPPVPTAAIIDQIRRALRLSWLSSGPWEPADRLYGPGKLNHFGQGPARLLVEWSEEPGASFVRVWGRGLDLHLEPLEGSALADFEQAWAEVLDRVATGARALPSPITRRAQQIEMHSEPLKVPEHNSAVVGRAPKSCRSMFEHRHITPSRPHRRGLRNGATALEVRITCMTPGCPRAGRVLHHYDLDGIVTTQDEEDICRRLVSGDETFPRDWCPDCGDLGVISFEEDGQPYPVYRK